MSTKTSKPKNKSTAQQKARVKPARGKAKKSSRSFQEVVGPEVYRTWVSMLHELVPDGRTHRLAPLLAAMLQYALGMAEDRRDEADENSIIDSLLNSTEVADPSEVEDLLHDVVTQLFEDAGVQFQRTSARGIRYSIAEDAYAEYIHWFDMPWE